MSTQSPNHILIVDDELLIALWEQQLLEQEGYRVSLAASGEEAVDLVCSQRQPFDLILLDINLGRGMDGTQAARKILETRDIPLVFISSHTEQEIVAKTEAITSYGYVVKNSSPAVLIASLKMAFKLSAAHRQLRASEARLRDIIFNSADWVWEVDENAVYTYSSPKGLEIFGRSTEEILGKTPFDFMLPQEAGRVGAYFAQLKADRLPMQDLEAWVLDKAGNPVCLLTNGLPILDAAGSLTGYRGVSKDITLRKAAEAASLESEIRFRTLSENALTGIYIIQDERFSYVNPTAARIFGYEQAELTGASPFLLYHPEDREAARVNFRRRLAEKVPSVHYQLRGICKNGEIKLVEVLGVLIELSGYPAVIGNMLDITERQQAEDALRVKMEEADTFFNQAQELLCIADTDGNFLRLNPEWANTLGYPLQELEGRRFLDFVHPEDVASTLATLNDLRSGKGVLDYSNRYRCQDGSYRWIEWRSTARGRLIYAAARDITARKQAEDALKASEEKWRRLFDLLPVGVSVVDAQNQVVEYNSALCQILDLSQGALQAGDFTQRRYLRPDRSVMPAEEFPSNRAVREQINVQNDEIGVEKEDGSLLWVRVSATPFVPGASSVTVTVDITPLKQVQEELKRSLQEKEVLMHELQHRIKNSLLVATGLLALEEHNLPDERSQAIFADTRSRLASMSAVYDQLYQSGGIDRIDLSQYIQNLTATLSKSYLPPGKAVRIEAHLEELPLDIKRALPLGIILNELIINALKYAFPQGHAPDGGPGIIRVELSRSGQEAQLLVIDNGVGMPSDAAQGGARIGLSLIAMLSRQILGRFNGENQGGYTARLTFPLN